MGIGNRSLAQFVSPVERRLRFATAGLASKNAYQSPPVNWGINTNANAPFSAGRELPNNTRKPGPRAAAPTRLGSRG